MKPETIEKRRLALEKDRKGDVTLWVPFAKSDMMFVKDCPVCHKPAVWTAIGKFACQACRYLFN